MGYRDRSTPPTEWVPNNADLIKKLSDNEYFMLLPEDNPGKVIFWHWCEGAKMWLGQSCSDHQLISRDPLHLEPSLACRNCSEHGFVREGRWIPV